MTQPQVNITELDGTLGVLPPSAGKLLALAGPADSGAVDTPASYAKVKDVVAVYGGGPLVEAAAHAIEKYGKPVLLVRSGASVEGSYLDAVDAEDGTISSITKTGTGTATFSDNASDPLVAAEVVILFNVGGTQGSSGIVYQISLDNGNTFGPPHALGTANHIDVGTTGASISISALGTIVAGDFISFTLTAPILASAGELDVSFSGSSTPTTHSGTHPNDDYEAYLEIVNGGTIGVDGITLRWSLDGGRTLSAVTALGTANFFVFPNSGGTRVDFSSGTVDAGDHLSFPTVAPRWNNTELGTALTALGNSAARWGIVEIVGPIDADAFDTIELKIAAIRAKGKKVAWIGNTRMTVGSESEATYLASLASVFGTKSSTVGALCAGADKMTSSVSGRRYRRPISHVTAPREQSLSPEIDSADVNLGSLGVSIRDANGNADEHDESLSPGLDDARFYVLRTWDAVQGVYVNRPRLFSADGSDFQLLPHRRVLDIAHEALNAYFTRRLNQPVLVDKTSGFILESEAQEIEAGARSAMRSALLAKPMASAVQFVLSRTDNLLSTKTMTGQARVIPLAYPEFINLDLGFLNPALQVQPAA
jgi:hypothetical protein